MALSASWIATWVIAYIRDSLSGLSAGAIHAASAASPAFAFHAVTAFDRAAAVVGTASASAPRSEAVRTWTAGTVPPIDGSRWTAGTRHHADPRSVRPTARTDAGRTNADAGTRHGWNRLE